MGFGFHERRTTMNTLLTLSLLLLAVATGEAGSGNEWRNRGEHGECRIDNGMWLPARADGQCYASDELLAIFNTLVDCRDRVDSSPWNLVGPRRLELCHRGCLFACQLLYEKTRKLAHLSVMSRSWICIPLQ